MRILALDFETGGVVPERHAPVSLGIAVMEGPQVLASSEWVFGESDKREYDVRALRVSGTTWSQIQAAPPVRDVMNSVQEWLRANADVPSPFGWPIVSHRASFDQAFWSDCLFLAGEWRYDRAQKKRRYFPFHELLCGPWVCTMRMMQGWDALPDYKLDTVAAHFGLSRSSEKHGALEDAILAGQVFHRLTGVSPQTTPSSASGEGGAPLGSQRSET